MSAQFVNPLLASEPFEELQNSRGNRTQTLDEYYNEMERMERKLSKSPKRRWSRAGKDVDKSGKLQHVAKDMTRPTPKLTKSHDKSSTQESRRPNQYFNSVQDVSDEESTKVVDIEAERELERERERQRERELEKARDKVDNSSNERAPAWAYKPGEWVKPSTPRPYYALHDPDPPAALGGRPYVYINHHLRPPGYLQPPSSVHLHPDTANSGSDYFRLPSVSRTQLAKVRAPGAHLDMVDSMDKSDPHGTKFHHQSPYDMGRSAIPRPGSSFVRGGVGVGTWVASVYGPQAISGPGSVEEPPSLPPLNPLSDPTPSTQRSRASSSSQGIHSKKSPSPLSQSTSALDIQEPSPTTPTDGDSTLKHKGTLTHKLSKREPSRRMGLKGLFGGGKDKEEGRPEQKDRSPSPLPPSSSQVDVSNQAQPKLGRTKTTPLARSRSPSPLPHSSSAPPTSAPATAIRSTRPPPVSASAHFRTPSSRPPSQTSDPKEKRSSLLGRLGRTFSSLRKNGSGTSEDAAQVKKEPSPPIVVEEPEKKRRSMSFHSSKPPLHVPVHPAGSGRLSNVPQTAVWSSLPIQQQPTPSPAKPPQLLPADPPTPSSPAPLLPPLSLGDNFKGSPSRSSSPFEPPKPTLHIANPDTNSTPTSPKLFPNNEPTELAYMKDPQPPSRVLNAPVRNDIDRYDPPSVETRPVENRSQPTTSINRSPLMALLQASSASQSDLRSSPEKEQEPSPSHQLFPLPPRGPPSSNSNHATVSASISQPILPLKSLLNTENNPPPPAVERSTPSEQQPSSHSRTRTISGPYTLAPARKPVARDSYPAGSPVPPTAPLPPPPRSRSKPESIPSQQGLGSRNSDGSTTNASAMLPGRKSSSSPGHGSGRVEDGGNRSSNSTMGTSNGKDNSSPPVFQNPTAPLSSTNKLQSPKVSSSSSVPSRPSPLSTSTSAPTAESKALPSAPTRPPSESYFQPRAQRPRPPSDTALDGRRFEVIEISSTTRKLSSRDIDEERGRKLGPPPAPPPVDGRSKSVSKSSGKLTKDPAKDLETALENAWTGPPLQTDRSKDRKRSKSWSKDVSPTSSRPPTPPPKHRSTRPPTSGTQRPQNGPRQPSPQKMSSASSSAPHSRSSTSASPLRLQKPTPPTPSATPAPEVQAARRRSQKRPVSVSTDSLPSELHAKEAWERERMIRGHSWIEFPNAAVAAPVPPPPEFKRNVHNGINGIGVQQDPRPVGHGSSYTSFTLQAPFSASSAGPHPSNPAYISSGDYYRQNVQYYPSYAADLHFNPQHIPPPNGQPYFRYPPYTPYSVAPYPYGSNPPPPQYIVRHPDPSQRPF